jgi:hypothetical protein
MTDFPVLDSPRTGDLFTYPGRAILDVHDSIEPYVDEMDYWVAMPVRLVHLDTAGLCIEVGPYTLDSGDIERLRAAIASYDLATGPTLRAVE